MDHGASDSSCAPVTYGDRTLFHYHRYLANALGVFQHLLKLFLLRFYVHIDGALPVSRPGLLCIRSAGFPIDEHLFTHAELLS